MNASREDRRQAARAKAEQLQRQQAARERRSRNILIAALAGIVALVVVVGIVIFNESKKTLLDSFEGAVPANSDNRGGFTVGPDAAGEPTRGAKTLALYLDFMCPYCGEFETANAEDLKELRANGDLNVTYHVVSNLDRASQGSQFSTRTANAVATVGDAAPEALVPFIEGVFANQPEEGTTGLTDAEIVQIALDAGVPQDVADTFVDGKFNDWVAVASEQAKRDGAPGTPTVKLNGDQLPRTVNYYQPGALAAWLAEEGVGQAAA